MKGRVLTQTTYLNSLNQIDELKNMPAVRRKRLDEVEEKYNFRSNSYYQSLIDWNDPKDPIRRIVVPHEDELVEWGQFDPSGEASYAVVPGLEHKYGDTALLLANDVCGALCRFCFRKRLFMDGNKEVTRDLSEAFAYILNNPQINNVLVTGGDPLLLSTQRLRQIIEELRSIDHVRVIRIGSKLLAFNPYRILDDPELVDLFRSCRTPDNRLYFMAHFNHPRELTAQAKKAILLLQQSGVFVMNQTPLIRGVNDNPQVLSELLNTLVAMGVHPYYIFQCRPTRGNFAYTVPVEEAYRNFLAAQRNCSGLARRVRFSMSHKTGKIEVVGLGADHIFFRYHRAADSVNEGRIIVALRNPEGYWFDDFEEVGLTEYSEALNF